MIDPTLAISDALVARLKADGGMNALVAGRVFDSVPANTQKPYANIGEAQLLPDKADCVDGTRMAFPVHGWANGPKSVEIKELGAAMLAALDEAEDVLTVQGHRIVSCEFEQVQYLKDPDPSIQHVVIVLIILTEPV
jgi:hypothetical protein